MKVKNKRKGFTLVEVLAVIVIIAIIAAITIPTVRKVMDSAKKDTFSLSAHKVLDAVYEEMLIDDYFDPTDIKVSNLKAMLNISNPNYKEVSITSVGPNEYYVEIEGKGKWKNLVACGVHSDIKVVSDAKSKEVCVIPIYIPPFDGEVNPPVLAKGMTPIKWVDKDGGGATLEMEETTEDDPAWYKYGIKKWANAVSYKHDENGEATPEIMAYWVWIPRYAYQIETCCHKNKAQCLADTGEEAGEISIKFLKGITNKTAKNEDVDIEPTYDNDNNHTNYVVHPAFTFGDDELTGFWVAKFEVSPDEGSSKDCFSNPSTTNCNVNEVTGIMPKILPGKPSWRYITIGNMFEISRKMETLSEYGWNEASEYEDGSFTNDNNDVDVHMLKNTEWGAVAYLGQSVYGKNARIGHNDNSSYYTGVTKNITDYRENCDCSTTNNVYGVYDMSGGAYEYVAAYLVGGTGTEGSTIEKADSKYSNRYGGYNKDIWGDAVWETSSSASGSNSWYGEYSSFPGTSYPWFKRGGYQGYSTGSGSFYFSSVNGSADGTGGWRVAVLVGEGL